MATHVLQQFAEYPFDSDEVYQQGLSSILAGEGLNGEDKDEILRRSRVFYFNRLTGHSLTVEDARLHEERLFCTDQESSASKVPGETRTLTFSELKEMIETGRTDQIPNNKVIPDALNDAPPSKTTIPVRKKPWESCDHT